MFLPGAAGLWNPMADHPVRLQAQEVFYHYPDGTAALGQIDLSIHDGEFIGLLGANGSGKTTLLKVLDGLIRDFKGTVTLDGSNIKTLTAKEIYGKMGMVFQNPDDQLFASTVFEDVAFGPINMGFSDREVKERVVRAMADVEMAGFAKKSIHHLSFGQKKGSASPACWPWGIKSFCWMNRLPAWIPWVNTR